MTRAMVTTKEEMARMLRGDKVRGGTLGLSLSLMVSILWATAPRRVCRLRGGEEGVPPFSTTPISTLVELEEF